MCSQFTEPRSEVEEMAESWAKLKETRLRLEKGWEVDIDWSLYPHALREVCHVQC